MSAHQLNLPLVTEDDLRLFHNKHFSSLSSKSSDRHIEASVNNEDNLYDDELGYYPDGIKRTLTDDQITMFRHSEIQALLRERRRRRENAGSEPVPDSSSEKAQPVGDLNTDMADDTVRQRSASASDPQGTGKRKWQRFIEVSESNPEHLTHRRIARELDEQKASSIDLAYGDEESMVPAYTKRHSASISRKQVAYTDEDDSAIAQLPSEKFQNPKFLWPTLADQEDTST